MDDVELIELEVLKEVEREGFERAFELGIGAIGDGVPRLIKVDFEIFDGRCLFGGFWIGTPSSRERYSTWTPAPP
jgi:hypothetical protein